MAGNVDQGTFRQILIRNIVLPLFLGVISCAVFVSLIFYIIDLNGWVRHTNDVLLKADEVERNLIEAQASLRGFAISQNEGFLEPYKYAVENYEKDLAQLKDLVSDNPPQVQRVEELKQIFEEWLAYSRKVLVMKREERFSYMGQGNGKKISDQYRAKAKAFNELEVKLKDERIESSHAFTRLAVGIAIVLSLIIGVLIAIFGRRQLLALSASYEEVVKKQNLQNEVLQTQNWMKSGQAELNKEMVGDQALVQLCEKVLSFVANYVGAKVAGMYVASEQKVFELKAAYAYPVNKTPLSNFNFGETLLGQAAKEGRIIETSDLPRDYFKVSSGLGDIKPHNSLIVPIKNGDQVNGVLEFGFTENLSRQKVDWLNAAAESIGIAIKASKYKEHLELLLEEVQNQAEELQSQQEELRVSNEELEEQSKVLKETQVRLEAQQAELEQTNSQLEEQAQALENQAEDLKEKNIELEDARQAIETKAEELKRSSQYKSEFLANMSHELRTPLNSSLILAKLLADNKSNNLTEEQIEYAKQIQSSGNDLLMLINDILDLSKVEAGKIDIVVDDVFISDFVRQLENTFKPISSEKKLSFKIDIGKDVPQKIITDSQRLEQVIKNLLSNAFKFTQEGSVNLKVEKSKDRSGFVNFTVKDTGIGIDPSKLDVIFEAFRQADGTTNRMFGGTGLGLSISRNLAHLLGGEIYVQSQMDEGSSFTVSIPEKYSDSLKKDLIKEESKPVVSKAPLGTIDLPKQQRKPFLTDDRESLASDSNVVLIVEDDPLFAKILIDIAQQQKFKCIVTDLAAEGLELAKTYKPHAILLDIKLPDHNGMIVLDQLKQNVSTRHIPVHIISGVDFIKDALEMGAVGYALKPTQEEELKKIFALFQQKISETIQKVLIIEDDKVQREAIRHLIRNDKVQTTAVGTGKEALAALKKENYNCIIVDLNLPDMTGFELLDEVSKLQTQKNLPVIVYTGRDLSQEEENRLRKHSESVIVKGARSPERLLSEVTLFLHQVESKLDPQRQKMLEELRNREKIFDKKSVLIVDDDMRNVFALTAVVESKGAKAIIAKNGQEALNKLDQEAVDIVLMDIMMPVMDGYKAMEAIRKQKKFDKLPIIALTAKAMKDDRELCLKAGASDYLAKPIDVEKLLSLMRIWISQGGRK